MSGEALPTLIRIAGPTRSCALRKARLIISIVSAFVLAVAPILGQSIYPQFAAGSVQVESAWEVAESVVVGDLSHIRELGIQNVNDLPWPASSGPATLHWCQGELSVVATIRGTAPKSSKYVWASAIPGCKIPGWQQPRKERPVTRVWFLRNERDFLRPIVDYVQSYFYEVSVPWVPSAQPSSRVAFARALITLNVAAVPEQEVEGAFYTPAAIACSILGDEECIERIRRLSVSTNPKVRRAANVYLELKAK